MAARLPIAMPVNTNTKSNGNDSHVEMNRHAKIEISPEDLDDEDHDDSGSDEDSKHDPFTQLYQAISQRIVVASKALVIASKIIKQLQNQNTTHKHHISRQEQNDDTHIQQSLRDSMSEAHIVIQQMEKLMLQFNQLPLEGTKQQQSDRRLQRSRLTKDFNDVCKKNKQISEVAKKLTSFDNITITKGRDIDVDSETTSLIAANSYQQSQIMESDVELSEQELAERQEQARRKHQFMLEIEQDVVHVHDMFKDLNGLVRSQQSGIDSIEAGILETVQRTRSGAEHLQRAEEQMRQKRKNMCCLVLLAVLATLVFVLFLWVIL